LALEQVKLCATAYNIAGYCHVTLNWANWCAPGDGSH